MRHTCTEEADTGRERKRGGGGGREGGIFFKKVVPNTAASVLPVSRDFSHLTPTVLTPGSSASCSLFRTLWPTLLAEARQWRTVVFCRRVCVYEMLHVLSCLFTPPGGRSLYHSPRWPVCWWGLLDWTARKWRIMTCTLTFSGLKITNMLCRMYFYNNCNMPVVLGILLGICNRCFSTW